jgi:hypothetical protein
MVPQLPPSCLRASLLPRSGVRAYVGHRMPNIIFLVTSGRGMLSLPPGTPPGYRALVEACLQRDHTARPRWAAAAGPHGCVMSVGWAAEPALAPVLAQPRL